MPMFEYECPSCSYSFELYQPTEGIEAGGSCPHCGGKGAICKDQARNRIDGDESRHSQRNRCGLFFG
jgi:putative FmdB family regulatory protein